MRNLGEMKKSRNHPSKASVSIYELQAKLCLTTQNFTLTSQPRCRFVPGAGLQIMRTKAQSDYTKDKAREGMSFDTSPEPDAPWKKELKKLAAVLPDEMRPEYNPEELKVVKKGRGREKITEIVPLPESFFRDWFSDHLNEQSASQIIHPNEP